MNRFGRRIANYGQKHIFTIAKIWTGINASYRRGNYEDLDWAASSYLDPLQINDIVAKDWFPKIDLDQGYIGDKYPLCADLPSKHFLKKNAQYRLLGGDPRPLWIHEENSWGFDEEFERLALDSDSPLYNKLCNPKASPPLPTTTLGAGSGTAAYSASFGAPYCQGSSAACNSSTLLEGRHTGEANNGPNTIDDCVDGTDASSTEAVNKIIVESVKGSSMRGGSLVKIKANVFAYNTNDQIDFYYASNAADPNWKFITKVSALQGENNPVTVPYTTFPDITFHLPQCTSAEGCQQVRFSKLKQCLLISYITNLLCHCSLFIRPYV